MRTIHHQLKNHALYIPDWKVRHLLIGTFNPAEGSKVNYYYGRERNQTWKLISNIFHEEFNPNNLPYFTDQLRRHGIACMDMIDHLVAPNDRIGKIIGKGYSDSAIINTSVRRSYNTDSIRKVIDINHGIRVYSTWGAGSKLKEWTSETAKLGKICPLVSPSMAAKVPKGEKKFEYMLSNWRMCFNN